MVGRVAHYLCLECRFEWEEQIPMVQTKPPFKSGSEPCPRCGHPYVKWLNYDEWRK